MKKLWSIVILCFVVVGTDAAIRQCGPSLGVLAPVVASGGGSGSAVMWYWNADSASASQSPQKGIGTVTLGASWVLTSTAPIVGTGTVWNSNVGNSGGRISVFSDSWNFDHGRLAFYGILKEVAGTAASDGDPFWINGDTGTVASKMQLQVNASGIWLFDFSNATQLNLGVLLAQDTTSFIEIAWDYTQATLGAPCKVYKDSVLVGTCAGTPNAGAPAGGNVRFGGQDGNATAMAMDQIIFSTNPVENLYALRAQTSF